MKASDNFKIDQAWWSKEKPNLMKSTGLGAVMKKFQDARTKLEELAKKGKYAGDAFNGPVDPFDAARAILDKELPAAIAKAKIAAGKMFKDTAAVLDKSPGVLAATKNTINSIEKDFQKTYQETHLNPKLTQIKGVLDTLEEEKVDSETTYKEVERFAKRIDDELADTKKDAKAVLEAADADLKKIKERCDVLAKKLTEAETAQKLANKLFAETVNVMSFNDRDTFKEYADKAILLKNAIFDVASRTKMVQAGATTAIKNFKSGSTTGKKPLDAKQLKRLVDLKLAMVQNQEVVRKIENNFSNTVLMPQKMIDAIKKAPDRASIVIPDGVSIPVAKWVSSVEGWVAESEKSLTQAKQIEKKCEEIKDTILKQIDDSVQTDPKGKTEIDEMSKKFGGISTYVVNLGKYVSIFKSKLSNLKNEWDKKA